MIRNIETYNGTLKVICRPTKGYPNGYIFYLDEEDAALLVGYNWTMLSAEEPCVVSIKQDGAPIYLHQLVMERRGIEITDSSKEVVHLNGVQYDCRRSNLVMMDRKNYLCYKPTKGYEVLRGRATFQPVIMIDKKRVALKCVHNELDAVIAARQLEVETLTLPFDIRYYFRGSENLLYLYIKGQMSFDEAVLTNTMQKINGNVWYIHRYNLEGYLEQFGVPVPVYSIGEGNRMYDKDFTRLLCPFG